MTSAEPAIQQIMTNEPRNSHDSSPETSPTTSPETQPDFATEAARNLLDLFDNVCSRRQRRFAVSEGILTRVEARRLGRLATMYHSGPFSRRIDLAALATKPDNYWENLVASCLTYDEGCWRRAEDVDLELTEEEGRPRAELVDEWRRVLLISQEKFRRQRQFFMVVDGLRKVEKEWNRSRYVGNLLISILSDDEVLSNRVWTVNRTNYQQYGFKRTDVGSTFVVLEQGATAEERRGVVNRISQLFLNFFTQNITNSLRNLELQYFLSQDHDFRTLIDTMYDETFSTRRIEWPQQLENDWNNLPAPVFNPAADDAQLWGEIIRENRPYKSKLAGLIKRPRPSADGDPIPDVAIVSIPRLCKHFSRVASDYYRQVIESARQVYTNDIQFLRIATDELVHVSQVLKVEQLKQNVRRMLVLVYQVRLEVQRYSGRIV